MKRTINKLTPKEFQNYVKEFFSLPMLQDTKLKLTLKEWCQSLKDTKTIFDRIINK